jgi:hypothetical protein
MVVSDQIPAPANLSQKGLPTTLSNGPTAGLNNAQKINISCAYRLWLKWSEQYSPEEYGLLICCAV